MNDNEEDTNRDNDAASHVADTINEILAASRESADDEPSPQYEKSGAFIGGLSGAFAGGVAGIVLGGITGAVTSDAGVFVGGLKGLFTGLAAGTAIGGVAGALVERKPTPKRLCLDDDECFVRGEFPAAANQD